MISSFARADHVVLWGEITTNMTLTNNNTYMLQGFVFVKSGALLPNYEINGLSLGNVGSRTIVEYVQVSYSNDDSFEWIGGAVNAKYLISLRCKDDDFVTHFGYSGKVQFAASLRDPEVADLSFSHGFESANDFDDTNNAPKTKAIFSNVTLVGPRAHHSVVADSSYKRAIHLRRNTEFSFYNSIVMGWPGDGIYIDRNSTAENAVNGLLQIRNIILADKDTVTTNATNGFNALAWFDNPTFGNTRLATNAEVNLADPFNLTNPNLTPLMDSPALFGADFSSPRLADSFFVSTTYRGASGSERWDLPWVNYNPQFTNYPTPPPLGVKQLPEKIPTKYTLEQNYPNPFNPSTQIKYGLPRAGHVTLKVLDLQGREIVTLVDQNQNAGEFRVIFNASALTAGVYFYRMSADGYKQVKRMILPR